MWSKPPVLIRAPYTTAAGERRTSILLASGWWGLARHFHYVPEIAAAALWTAPVGGATLAWFYVFFLTVRAERGRKGGAGGGCRSGRCDGGRCRAVPPARHADRRRPPTRIPLPLLLTAAAVRPRLSRRRPLRRQVRGRLGQVGRKRGQTGRSRGVCGLVGLGREVRFSSLCICLHPRPHPHATLLTSSLDPDSNSNRPNLCGRYRALVPAKIVPGVF